MNGLLVVGPESSGSKAIAESLLSAGGGREPDLAEGYPDSYVARPCFDGTRPLVVHRSFPYAGRWPEIDRLMEQMQMMGAPVDRVLVCFRSFEPIERSLLARGYGSDPQEIRANIREAYGRIFSGLAWLNVDVIAVSLESLCHHEGAFGDLLERCGLGQGDFEFYDADARWW